MRYIHSARCACYGLRKLCCCVLGIVYANERTNERTIMHRSNALSSTCGCLGEICVTLFCAKEAWSWSGILFALRYCSIGIIITCFRADFNLWGRFLIGNGYQLSRPLPIGLPQDLKFFDFFKRKTCSFGYFGNVKAEPFSLSSWVCFLTQTAGSRLKIIDTFDNPMLYYGRKL